MYFGRVLTAISQLGNALSFGNPDVPISARTHYYAQTMSWFKLIESLIDFAFYPFDGKHHCKIAYLADKEERIQKGELYSFIFISLFVVAVCIPMIFITWSYYFLSKIWLKK